MPGLTPDGSSVFFLRLMDSNPANMYYVEHVKLVTMMMDLYVLKTGPTKNHKFLCDMQGMQIGHLMRMNMYVGKKMNMYMSVREKHF